MSLKEILFWFITIQDLIIAFFIFISALNTRMLTLSLINRIGLLLTAFGFASESGLSMPYLLFGEEVSSQSYPLWVLKDMGIGIIIFYFLYFRSSVNSANHRSRSDEM